MLDQVALAAGGRDAGWCVGLMTGTVLDGEIDVAFLRTDGEAIHGFGPAETVPYDTDVTATLREALGAARGWDFAPDDPPVFAQAERAATEAQAHAVLAVAARHGIPADDVAVVGFHGHTVLHRPPVGGRPGRTRQLGDGAAMARIVGAPVVFTMRADDMAAGGQGAPLAPAYHRALLDRDGRAGDTVVLNLGGVGNLTWCGAGDPVAFDTGPANAPVDDWVRAHTGAPMDRDGAMAARGRVDEARITHLLDHPYLAASYPKSLDRDDFTAAMAEGLSPEDGAATLTAFAAACVARGLAMLPGAPRRIAVGGGGRRNPVLMAEVARRTGLPVEDADALGWRGDALEAEAFAFLAARRVRGLPTSFPSTTGAARPVSGGKVAMP